MSSGCPLSSMFVQCRIVAVDIILGSLPPGKLVPYNAESCSDGLIYPHGVQGHQNRLCLRGYFNVAVDFVSVLYQLCGLPSYHTSRHTLDMLLCFGRITGWWGLRSYNFTTRTFIVHVYLFWTHAHTGVYDKKDLYRCLMTYIVIVCNS